MGGQLRCAWTPKGDALEPVWPPSSSLGAQTYHRLTADVDARADADAGRFGFSLLSALEHSLKALVWFLFQRWSGRGFCLNGVLSIFEARVPGATILTERHGLSNHSPSSRVLVIMRVRCVASWRPSPSVQMHRLYQALFENQTKHQNTMKHGGFGMTMARFPPRSAVRWKSLAVVPRIISHIAN